jgi:hypothetical protein
MKNINTYINESSNRDWEKKYKKFKKLISKEDMKLFSEIANDKKTNNINTSEDIEQMFWKGELKDKVDDIWKKIDTYLNQAGSSSDEVCDRYSLARSGKQYKIEVSAQMIYFLNTR